MVDVPVNKSLTTLIKDRHKQIVARAIDLAAELDLARTLDEVQFVEAKGKTLVTLAKSIGADLVCVNAAVCAWLECMWELGRWLGPGKSTQGRELIGKTNKLHWRDKRHDARRFKAAVLSRDLIPAYILEKTGPLQQATLTGCIQWAAGTPDEQDIPAPPAGLYSCLVVDPPWPMKKIPMDVRPLQGLGELAYKTMSIEEITDWGHCLPAADNAHLYLWTTQRFLPASFAIAEAWGFRYQCLLTWVKNVGMTPYSWMYSTEHVLFCRRGNLKLLRNGLRLDFAAKTTGHSRKPDEFYELVKRASPAPRIDLFSRESRDGFKSWGDERGKFDGDI